MRYIGGLRIAADRRVNAERRRADRRGSAAPVPLERRRGADRRRVLARREEAGGHVRHAIQLLETLLTHGTLVEDDREDVQAALRRLWFALSEIERTGGVGAVRVAMFAPVAARFPSELGPVPGDPVAKR